MIKEMTSDCPLSRFAMNVTAYCCYYHVSHCRVFGLVKHLCTSSNIEAWERISWDKCACRARWFHGGKKTAILRQILDSDHWFSRFSGCQQIMKGKCIGFFFTSILHDFRFYVQSILTYDPNFRWTKPFWKESDSILLTK